MSYTRISVQFLRLLDKRGKLNSHPGDEVSFSAQADIAACFLSLDLYPSKVV